MNSWKCLLLVLCSVISVTLIACKSNSEQTDAQGAPMVDESQRILDKDAFAAAIKKRNAVVVDLRYPHEFNQSHIQDAININFFDTQFKWKILELDRKDRIYLYGKNENTSYRAMKFMEENGFRQVYYLKDGYKEWNTAREPQ